MKKILLLVVYFPLSPLHAWPLTVYKKREPAFIYNVTPETSIQDIKDAVRKEVSFSTYAPLRMYLLSLSRGIYVDFKWDSDRNGKNILTNLDLNADDSKDIFFVSEGLGKYYKVFKYEVAKNYKPSPTKRPGTTVLDIYDGSIPRKLLLTYTYNYDEGIQKNFENFKKLLSDIIKSEFNLILFSEFSERMGVQIDAFGFKYLQSSDSEDIYVMLPLSNDAPYPIYTLYKAPVSSASAAPVPIEEEVLYGWLKQNRGASLDVKTRNFILMEGAYEYNKNVTPAGEVNASFVRHWRNLLESVWEGIKLDRVMNKLSFTHLD